MIEAKRVFLTGLVAWLSAASPATAGGMAWLQSRPSGAVVLLDGRYAGVTPYRRELPAGMYNVSLNSRGFKAKAFRIRVAERRTTKVALSLTATARLADVAQRQAAASRRERARAAAARAARQAATAQRTRLLAKAGREARIRSRVSVAAQATAQASATRKAGRPSLPVPAARAAERPPAAQALIAPITAAAVVLPLGDLADLAPEWTLGPDAPAPASPLQDMEGWLILLGGLVLGGLVLGGRKLLATPLATPEPMPLATWRAGEGADPTAVAALRLGCWEAAAQTIEDAMTESTPTNWQAYNLGVARQRQGRVADAERAYRAALAVNPNDRDAGFNLANALEEQDDHAAAVIAYRDVLDRRPEDLGALVNLALLYETIGMVAEAAETWACAEKAAPRGTAIKSAAANESARLQASRSFARISFKRITASSLGLGTGKTSSGRTWG